MKGKIEAVLAAQKLSDKWNRIVSFSLWEKTLLAAVVGLIAWPQFFKWVKANWSIVLVLYFLFSRSLHKGRES